MSIVRIAVRVVSGALAGSVLMSLTSASAAEVQPVGVFKDWAVMVQETGADRICFAVTEAKDKAPKSVNHGEIFFMVATWKSGVASNQPSFRAGYNLKDSPAPAIRIGAQKWDMYVSENESFIESAAAEQSLIAAMRSGADMRISATSGRGTATNYIFSLNGVSAALERAKEACM
jgi:invasion protein IalB